MGASSLSWTSKANVVCIADAQALPTGKKERNGLSIDGSETNLSQMPFDISVAVREEDRRRESRMISIYILFNIKAHAIVECSLVVDAWKAERDLADERALTTSGTCAHIPTCTGEETVKTFSSSILDDKNLRRFHFNPLSKLTSQVNVETGSVLLAERRRGRKYLRKKGLLLIMIIEKKRIVRHGQLSSSIQVCQRSRQWISSV